MPFTFARHSLGTFILPTDNNELQQGIETISKGVYNVCEPVDSPQSSAYARGDGVTDDSGAFALADTNNGGNGVTYAPPTSARYLFSASKALAHALRLPPSAILKPASGVTVTLNGAIDADAYQIFDLSAGGAVALGPGAAPGGVRWEWFGTDAAALQAAIAAAEGAGQGQAKVVCQPGKSYTIASGVTLKRSTILDLCGAAVTYTGTTGVAIAQSTASDTGWQVGGVRNGKLVGSGGTATGLQVGGGTASAQGIVCENVDISGFQDGALVTSTNGQAFLDCLRSCAIHNNGRDGVRLGCSANEQLMLRDCAIFNNATAGVHNVGGSVATVYQTGGSLDFNGANVLNDAAGNLEYHAAAVHFESSNAPHLASTQTALGGFVATLENCQLAQDATLTAAMVAATAGILRFLGCNFALSGFSASPVALGDAGNHAVDASFLGNKFTSTGSAAVNWVTKVTTAGSTIVVLGNGQQTGSALALIGGNIGVGDTVISDASTTTYGDLTLPGLVNPKTLQLGSSRALSRSYAAAANLNFGSVAAQSTAELAISMGTQAGDFAGVVPDFAIPAGIMWTAYCTTNGTVIVRVANVTTGAIAVSGTFVALSLN